MRTYDGPEHESLRAVIRCMVVNYGVTGRLQAREYLMRVFQVSGPSELSPWGANCARKNLEKHLPIRGDYAS
jgi:hypothetical protein